MSVFTADEKAGEAPLGLVGGWSLTCDTIYSPDFWSPGLTQTLPSAPQDVSSTPIAVRSSQSYSFWSPGLTQTLPPSASQDASSASAVRSSGSFANQASAEPRTTTTSFDIVEDDDEVIDLPLGMVSCGGFRGGGRKDDRNTAVTSKDDSSPELGPEVLEMPHHAPPVLAPPQMPSRGPTEATSENIDRLAEVVAGLAATVGSLAEMQVKMASPKLEEKIENGGHKEEEVIEPLSTMPGSNEWPNSSAAKPQANLHVEDQSNVKPQAILHIEAQSNGSDSAARSKAPHAIDSCSDVSAGTQRNASSDSAIVEKPSNDDQIACIYETGSSSDGNGSMRRHSDVTSSKSRKGKKRSKQIQRSRSLGPHFFNICEDDSDESFRPSPRRSQSPRKSPRKSLGGVVDGSVSEFGIWLCQQRPRFRFNQAAGMAWDFPLDQSEKRELLIAHMAIGEDEAKKEAERSSMEYDNIVRRVSLGTMGKQKLASHARRTTRRLSGISRKTRPVSCSRRGKRKSLGSEAAVACD